LQHYVYAPCQNALPFLHRSYELMRQSKTLLLTRFHPKQQAFADCCQSPLGDCLSRRYLCRSFTGCLDPYPGGFLWCIYPFVTSLLFRGYFLRWRNILVCYPTSIALHLISIEGVAPTNKILERGIRPAAQWREMCFGNRSHNGIALLQGC
jgi:hypothetical protein